MQSKLSSAEIQFKKEFGLRFYNYVDSYFFVDCGDDGQDVSSLLIDDDILDPDAAEILESDNLVGGNSKESLLIFHFDVFSIDKDLFGQADLTFAAFFIFGEQGGIE